MTSDSRCNYLVLKNKLIKSAIFDMCYLPINNHSKERNPIKMHNIPAAPENQSITPDKLGIFGNYFSMLKIGNMLNKSGISKTI